MKPRYPSRRIAWRVFRFALATVAGGRPMGYFIPYRYRHSLPDPAERGGYDAVAEILAARQNDFLGLLACAEDYAVDIERLAALPAPAPRFDQDWFPTLDAVAAYCLLRQRRPTRLIEVGSGHSTRFFAAAIKDGGFACQLTAIDPAPRASLAELEVDILTRTLDQVDANIFRALAPGDVLSIDSSHILMPGSDVDDLLNRILPRLAAGVLVHIHDIFLPDPYPESWAWRGYNEQQAVAPLITSGAYRAIFASHYLSTRQPAALTGGLLDRLPKAAEAHPASLWLEKT